MNPASHHRFLSSLLVAVTLLFASFLLITGEADAAEYQLKEGIAYYPADTADAYQKERCVLDIYYPADKKDFATVVWFHGGGLQGGEKSIPKGLKEQGFAIIAVNYRLSPKVKSPTYVEDASAAVAWVMNNIAGLGGDKDKIVVSGHSAGGYLSTMVLLDERWLAAHKLEANSLAGLVSYSGQTITHSTIRKERGISETKVVVDDMAPLRHLRKDAPPIVLITGDREKEMRGRYEENAYLWRMLRVNGHQDNAIHELPGKDHGSMVEPGHKILIDFMQRFSAAE